MSFFNILSFDPGNNLGVSILSVDVETLNIINIETRTIVLDTYIDNNVIDKSLHKLNFLNSVVISLLDSYKPVAVGMETAFLNVRFPKAVTTLSQLTGVIDLTVLQHNNFIKMFKFAPKYIKAIASGKGTSDKDGMLSAATNNKEISSLIDLSYLTEHEIDSIMIGYTALLEIRKYPMVLFMVP